MKLDFSSQTISDVILSIQDDNVMDWQLDILNFLEKYKEQESEIQINELQGENIFTVEMKRENIQNTVRELNSYLKIKEGDKTLISHSLKTKSGVISLAQAIEGKMEAYCVEPTNTIKIPYTGQDQNEIHWGLNYVYVSENQIAESEGSLHRIEKIAIESNGLKDETEKSLVSPNSEQQLFDVFSVKSFPVGIKNFKDDKFTVLGNVQLNKSENGQLIINSPNFQEEIDTQKAVVLTSEKSFRWLTSGEYLDTENDLIVNFEHIEEVLEPFIDTRFVVINFPDKNSNEEVVTLVVERRYMEEFNYPTDDLKEHEIPKQTYFLGEFPENNDRASIRKEVKRLLNTN